ncbi:MAG: hypothetical protein GKR91_20400 [Pseudomonadales bacterium]|nr:hypothetical protein [Pseudomonadales bacterium]
MQSADLKSILRQLEESADNTTSFDESWSQGRSAYGGIATAFAVTGMRKLLTSPKPLRSLMVSFIAPVPPGEVKVEASIQRQGKNVTQMSGNVICNGELCLQAMAAFGNPREGLKVSTNEDFNPSPRESGVEFKDHKKRVPGFLQFFDGAWVDGGLPFGGKPSNELNLWIRHKADMSGFETEKLVTICDIPPPVILSYLEKGPIPSSSLSWSLEFVIPPEEIKSDWFYLEFVAEAAANGYTQQSGKIYDETGQLCALSRQCMVYFG